MSGITGSKLNIRGSGIVAQLGTDGQVLTSGGAGVAAEYEDVVGGVTWQAVETGSTMTAVAGNGYPINTTSNACTITLPASASNGDQIIFTDYARNWATNEIIIDSNGLNYQGDDDTFNVEYSTDGQSVHIVYSGATQGWIPTIDDDVTDAPVAPKQGLFGFGTDGSNTAVTNLVSTAGVIGTDVTGVGTARQQLGACEYGGDKGIFAYGYTVANVNMSNLVSNAGVVATDVTGVGTARSGNAACSYGEDKGIFGYGWVTGTTYTAVTNLVSNAGVVATDTAGVGTVRGNLTAAEFGGDQGIFGFGGPGNLATTNLVSNTGVVGADVAGVGTGRTVLAGAAYGTDKGLFGFGSTGGAGRLGVTNLISNVGVVSTDTAAVGTARSGLGATQWGADKAIFAFGTDGSLTAVSNLVSNTGVVATDTSGVGTAQQHGAACSFG